MDVIDVQFSNALLWYSILRFKHIIPNKCNQSIYFGLFALHFTSSGLFFSVSDTSVRCPSLTTDFTHVFCWPWSDECWGVVAHIVLAVIARGPSWLVGSRSSPVNAEWYDDKVLVRKNHHKLFKKQVVSACHRIIFLRLFWKRFSYHFQSLKNGCLLPAFSDDVNIS